MSSTLPRSLRESARITEEQEVQEGQSLDSTLMIALNWLIIARTSQEELQAQFQQ